MSCSLSVPGGVWEEGWRLWALDIDLPLPALLPRCLQACSTQPQAGSPYKPHLQEALASCPSNH